MTFGEVYPLLAMLLSHMVVHIPILSPFLFRQSYIYCLFLNQRIFYLLVIIQISRGARLAHSEATAANLNVAVDFTAGAWPLMIIHTSSNSQNENPITLSHFHLHFLYGFFSIPIIYL